MARFLFPFLLALAVHGIISLVPWEQRQIQQPKAGGENSITVDIQQSAVPEVQQPSEVKPQETEFFLLPKPTLVETTKTKDSPPLARLPIPSTIEIKSEKHKVIKRRPPAITNSAPTLQTSPLVKEQNRVSKGGVTSNVLRNRKAQPQAPPAIKAKPLYQKNPKPPYPPLARRRNWQGTVLLLVTVDYQGLSEKVKLLKGSGYPILDKAAKKTVEQWVFSPGQINGKPAVMEVQVPILFILE